MTTDWKRLTAPFPATDIEWRIGRAGKNDKGVWATCLAYVTARAIQDRMDEVFTPGGWKNEYHPGPEGGVLCRLWFKNDEGEWVWREDAAENTDIEAVKGGISGATKRAGAALGIGRYLYDLDEGWANIHERGANFGKTKEGTNFRWDPPSLPGWALPEGIARSTPQPGRMPPKEALDAAEQAYADKAETRQERQQPPVENKPVSGISPSQQQDFMASLLANMAESGVKPKDIARVAGAWTFDAVDKWINGEPSRTQTLLIQLAKEEANA
jgi:hypothetical protein